MISLSPREFNRLTRAEKLEWMGERTYPPQSLQVLELAGIVICFATDAKGRPGNTILATTRKVRDEIRGKALN